MLFFTSIVTDFVYTSIAPKNKQSIIEKYF